MCPTTMAQRNHENRLDSSINLNFDVLLIIFGHLNGRDLANATMVCRSWLEAANYEKRRRGPCHYLINLKEMDSYLSYIKNIRIKPLAAFFFTSFFLEQQSCFSDQHSIYCLENCIQNLLPEHCEVIMLYSSGAFLASDSETRFNPNIIGAFLPQIPNVRIETYEVTEDYNTVWNNINTNVTREMIDEFESNHETSISFIFFCNQNIISFIRTKHFISYMQERKTFQISSLLNIVLEDIYVPNKTNRRLNQRIDEPNCIAVMITGPIKTWSVILEKNCDTQEHIEARLQLFKDEIKLKKYSLGFMFSRTSKIEKINMVVTIFKRLFPEISPLTGCFTGNLVDYSNVGRTTDEVNKEKYDKVFRHKCEIAESSYTLLTDFDIMFLILTYD